MATPGGTPPTGDSLKPKREFTPEQKRTFAGLGVAGVLALIVGVMYLPGLLSGGGSSSVPTAPPTSPGAGAGATNAATSSAAAVPTTGPGAGLGGAPVTGGPATTTVSTTTVGTVGAQPVVFISQARTDPFQPVYIVPPPAPTPTPPPPPDPQISIPAPPGFENGVTLPAIKDPAVRAAAAAPLRIGLPIVPRLDSITAPRDAFPLPSAGGGTVGGTPQQSYDKRLAGIIIGDGVRALLELPSGEQRVVQPGDEIEGIRVLSIERFRQGDRTVTRMLVRDTDGSQKYVELKASTQAQQTTGGEGGAPGALRGPG